MKLVPCAFATLALLAATGMATADTTVVTLDSVLTWETDHWEDFMATRYTYDDIFLKHVVRDWYAGGWVDLDSTCYLWQDTLVSVVVTYDFDGYPADSTVYVYDENKNCTLMVVTDWVGPIGGPYREDVVTVRMTYDAGGNRLDSAASMHQDGTLSDTSYTSFAYDGDNRTDMSVHGYRQDSTFGELQAIRYTFTTEGALDSTIMSIFFGTAMMDYLLGVNVYSGDTLVESQNSITDFTGGFDLSSHTLFYYDAEGRDSVHLNQRRRGSGWQDRSRATYTWVPEGYVEWEHEESYDTTAGEWRNTTLRYHAYETIQMVGAGAARNTARGTCGMLDISADARIIRVMGGAGANRIRVMGLNGRVVACGKASLHLPQTTARGVYPVVLTDVDGRTISTESALLAR